MFGLATSFNTWELTHGNMVVVRSQLSHECLGLALLEMFCSWYHAKIGYYNNNKLVSDHSVEIMWIVFA